MERLRIESLNGNKQMVKRFRFLSAHIKLAEIGIFQHTCKGITALFKDFLSMGNEQQAISLGIYSFCVKKIWKNSQAGKNLPVWRVHYSRKKNSERKSTTPLPCGFGL